MTFSQFKLNVAGHLIFLAKNLHLPQSFAGTSIQILMGEVEALTDMVWSAPC